MTFFYDLNKKLKGVLDAPKSEHKQLNERDMSRAAKGYEKYGKEGMQALAKAGREGKSLDKIRDKYDRYDKDLDEGSIQGGVWTATPPKAGQPNVPVPQNPEVAKPSTPASVPAAPGSAIRVDGKPIKEKKTFADKIAGAKKEVDEMLGDVAAEAMRGALKGGQKKLDKNNNGRLDAQDFAMLRKGKDKTDEGDFGPMEGSTGDYSAKKARAGKDIGKPGKAFAKIAKSAGERYGSKERGEKVAGAVLAKLRGKKESAGEMDEGWDDMLKDVERRRSGMKTGEKVQGHKGEIEKTATGIKHTRKYDPKTGETDTGDDAPKGEKRRGRPKGTGKSIGAKGPSGNSKLMKKEGFDVTTPAGTFSTNTGTMTPPPMPESKGGDLKAAMALLKKAGYKVTKDDAKEPVEEKAVSKAQQRFMGMVHATQKGEKAPSKEVAKVAKSMGKKDAEDFAATKHKGLPEKKKKKTEEAGGVDTPTASSGFSFGKGIYDSINRELEEMIAESMNISMNTNSDGPNGPSKSLTVTATEEDAAYLAQILKSAGLGGEGHGGCGCGETPCSCGSDAEHVDENKPDWPTNAEYSDDALQYSGGLNKPKTDVAGDGQTTVPVAAVHTQDEDDLRRLREMAGIKEAPDLNTTLGIKSAPTSAPTPYKGPDLNTTLGIKSTPASTPASTSTAPDINKLTINAMKESDDVEEGNEFTGNLAKARAAGKKEADLDGDGDMEKVKESILDMKHLWTEYKG